ncbi:MAG: HD-GYP domain-containing protein [Candidatus Fermentibacteraceae bacterium]|nr:HD-GYP domain-containing protein [Candidatus Fermentibacteraceae bacterium]
MISGLSDLLVATGFDSWFPGGPDSLFFLILLAVGSAVTGGLPMFMTPGFEFSLNRVFVFTMFFLFPIRSAAFFALASVAAGAALRMAFSIRRFWRFSLSGLLMTAVLFLGPGVVAAYRPDISVQIALLYALPVLLALELILNIACSRETYELSTFTGRMLISYLATLPLTLMVVIMVIHSGRLGMGLALTGLIGFSFIGRSINRKHEWNTMRISEISQQDRLATKLMESSSYGEFLGILRKNLLSDPESDVTALTRSGGDHGWILWGRSDHTGLQETDLKGEIPGKGSFNRGFTAGKTSGTALGLSDNRELVLLITGPEKDSLVGMPSSLLENLVLLLEHTWEAVGHSVRSERSFLAAAVMLARLADAKDDYTHGHSLRVADLSCALGRHLGLSSSKVQTLRVAAILHDIGKLAIPASILTKRGLLTRKEREIVEAHSLEGARIVSGLSGYEEVARIIMSHHERLDGMGYPEGISGEDIPFMARIVAVADTFDAITSDRSYHSISGWEKALESIKAERGDKFDARIVSALEKVITEEYGEMA